MKRSILLPMLLLATSAIAQQAVGPTYPIVEPDMLKEIERVLKEKERTGELARLQKEAIERSRHSALNPRAVQGLQKTAKARSFYFDPSVTAEQDIRAADGTIVVRAGTTFNPLDHATWNKWFVFIDGTDAKQVTRAEAIYKEAGGRAKIVLTAGSYVDLQKRWGHPVYFDQGGTLVRRFGITQVPAVISQEGKKLRVDEITY
jgi:conjugal transfer pilus assembly protein TraW